MSMPSASSPTATATPPAPKSLQRLIMRKKRRVAVEAVEGALHGGISLLHFGAGDGDGLLRMLLARPRGATNAVAAGAAA